MSVHVNVASTWKDSSPSVHAGGSWQDADSTTAGVESIYINIAGTWRMTWPLLDATTIGSISRSLTKTVATTTYMSVLVDGRIETGGTSATSSYTNYCSNGGDTDKAGNADTLFQYKWEPGAGTPTTSPVASGTWTDITGTHTWNVIDNSPSDSPVTCSFTLHIRAKDAPSSEVQMSVLLSASYEPI